MILFSVGKLKSRFVRANLPRTPLVWKRYVPNKINIAIVLQTIKVEFVRNRIWSQLFHICLQRNLGFCRGGELHDR